MNLEVFLSLFSLMLISLLVFVLAKKLRIPYTVLLVIVGSLLVPLSQVELFAFITSFDLTPELLFFVFLPILIFESAYNMNISNIGENIRAIGLLAIASLLISTFFIGAVGSLALTLFGFEVPTIVMLLFGAVISATDPVAVLALFKEYGAPRRLTLIFEGESLFNDGTAFAAFLVLLDVLLHGFGGFATLLGGLFSFVTMLAGGIVFGLVMGFLFAKLIEWVRGNEHLEMTLTLLVAHFTFILTELISEHLVILGQPIRLSSIIATLVASMVIGNFGRYKMSPAVEEYMEKFWSYFAFLTNSLVFILMGLLFAELSIDLDVAIWPILVAILVVMIGRAASIYPVLVWLNRSGREARIPASWMHLLSWGSLRGSLAVIMVLLIPDDATLPGWRYDFSVKEFIAAITIGCIYFTLLFKATSIGTVMRKLGIDALTPNEEISYLKSKALIYEETLRRLDQLREDQLLDERQYRAEKERFQKLYERPRRQGKEGLEGAKEQAENLLRLYVLGVEKEELRRIFQRDEITEKIYKKILHMLNIQCERLERGRPQLTAPDEKFPADSLEKFINVLRRALFLSGQALEPVELYVYYRTQYRLIEKALDQLASLGGSSLSEVFDDKETLEKINALYRTLLENTRRNMEEMIESNRELLTRWKETAAKKSLDTIQAETLEALHKNEIISSKLFIMLSKELDKE